MIQKVLKPKPKPKKRLIKKLQKAKLDPIVKLSVTKKERKVIGKNIKQYKLNLLRNRPVLYQLKNLNSKQELSFYNRKVHKD